jgi:hypothetical protein
MSPFWIQSFIAYLQMLKPRGVENVFAALAFVTACEGVQQSRVLWMFRVTLAATLFVH